MPFKQPIVAGTKLIREAIQSPNYVPGLAGWSINKDGSAEFNSVEVRSELYVRGDGKSFIRIYYDGSSFTQPRIELMPDDPVSVNTFPALILADIVGGEPFLSLNSPATPDVNSDRASLRLFGDRIDDGTFARALLGNNASDPRFQFNVTGGIDFTRRLTWNGVDGNVFRVTSNRRITDTAAIGNTETVVLTIPAQTYTAGRMYELRFNGKCSISAAAPNRPLFRIRQTDLTGLQIRSRGIPVVVSGQEHSVEFSGKFRITTMNDVNTALVVTVSSTTAAFNVTVLATSDEPTYADVYDIGISTNGSNLNIPLLLS